MLFRDYPSKVFMAKALEGWFKTSRSEFYFVHYPNPIEKFFSSGWTQDSLVILSGEVLLFLSTKFGNKIQVKDLEFAFQNSVLKISIEFLSGDFWATEFHKEGDSYAVSN